MLLGVYRRHVNEICIWLEELAGVAADPALAVQKRGVSKAGNIEITVTLKLTIPPEMKKLEELTRSLFAEPKAEPQAIPAQNSREANRPGILGTLGALAFGIGISKAIFGNPHS